MISLLDALLFASISFGILFLVSVYQFFKSLILDSRDKEDVMIWIVCMPVFYFLMYILHHAYLLIEMLRK